METSSAEAAPAAPTTVDSHTQTEPVKVPRLASRRTKIKNEDIVALDKLAFTCKKNMQIREGQDVRGPSGFATRAKSRCVKQLIKHVAKKDLITEQTALVLREALAIGCLPASVVTSVDQTLESWGLQTLIHKVSACHQK